MHKIWPGRRAHWVKYKNINNLDLDGMSLASFCQRRAELSSVGSCPMPGGGGGGGGYSDLVPTGVCR